MPQAKQDADEGEDKDERVTVRVPSDLVRQVKALAAKNDESLSRVVRQAFRAYLAAGPQQLDLEDAIARQQKPRAKPRARR